MDINKIRSGLKRARAALFNELGSIDEFDFVTNDEEVLNVAKDLADEYPDCKAYVEVVEALKELEKELGQ